MAKTLGRMKTVEITYIEDGQEKTDRVTVAKAPLGKWKQLTESINNLLEVLPEILKKKGVEDPEKYIEQMGIQEFVMLIPDMLEFAVDEIINVLAIGTGLTTEYIEEKVGLDETIDLLEAIIEVNGIVKVVEKGKKLKKPLHPETEIDEEELFDELIWELVDITRMSKKEVLEQIYPDELEYIFRKKQEREIRRFESYQHLMIAVAAGFGAETENGESLYKVYSEQLNDIIEQLKGTEVEEKEYVPEDVDREIEKLKGFLGIVEKSRQTKRPPEGVKK